MKPTIKRIKESRKEAGLSQKDIAKKIGCTRVTYLRFESGNEKCLSSGQVFKLLKVLKLEICSQEIGTEAGKNKTTA